MSEITQILHAIASGDSKATDELLPLVYLELRRSAAKLMENERSDHTLQTTALVHEAYLRLVDKSDPGAWNSRQHFFCAAAEAMRRILIESARRKRSLKRGGDCTRLYVEIETISRPQTDEDILALDEALTKFHDIDPRAVKLVELRFFAGLTMGEAAAALDISVSTAERDWAFARAWLREELTDFPEIAS